MATRSVLMLDPNIDFIGTKIALRFKLRLNLLQTCIGNSLHPGKKWCGNKKLVENSLCCFGKLFENAKGCCGAKGVKKDQICCGSNVFNIRKGYW